MRLFLSKTVLLFIVAVCVFKLLDMVAVFGLSKLRDDDFKDLSMLYNNEIDDEILILGSSRAWNHFNIKKIEKNTGIKSIVIGLSGADFNMQRALWEHVLHSENNINYIVRVVGALEFSKREDGIYKKYKFFPHLDNEFVYSNLSYLQDDLWKDKYIPQYEFHGNYEYLTKGIISKFGFNKSTSYSKYKGFKALKGVWDGVIDIDSKVISKKDRLSAIHFMKEEARLANDKNKVLLIVYAPEYFKTNIIVKGKNKVLENIGETAADYENVYFLDYSEWYGNTDLKLFHNATHLNAEGAKLFSETFSEDFQKIINLKKL